MRVAILDHMVACIIISEKHAGMIPQILLSSASGQGISFVYGLEFSHHHAFLMQKRLGSSFELLSVSNHIALWS